MTAGQPPEGSRSLRSTTIRGARLAMAGYAITRGTMFMVFVALARLITPTQFGQYAAASVVVGVGTLFAESGMMSALIQRTDRLEEAASTAFYSQLVGGVLLSAAALALAPAVGLFFRAGPVEGLAAALSGGMFLRAMTVVPDALLQRRFSFARRVAVDPLGAIAFAAASIVLCAGGAGAWGLVAGSYASLLVQVVSAWWFVHFRPRRKLASIQMWRELASFARHVLGSEILSRVAGQLDTLMLGRFSGAAALGQYQNGLRLALQPSDAFVGVASYVLLPALARIATETERLASVARRVFRLLAVALVPLSLAFLPLGEPVAVLLLGPRWRPAGHAIAALLGLMLAGPAISVSAEVLKATRRPEVLVRIQFVSLCTMAIFVSAAAPTLGLVGVAAAVSVSRLLTAGYAFHRVAPLIGIGWRGLARTAAGPVAAAAVMLLVMLGVGIVLNPLNHARAVAAGLTVAQAVTGAVAYVLTLLLVDSGRRRSALEFLAASSSRRRSPLRVS